MSSLQIISSILGALYVTAWSVSFYPPLLLNYRLQSSEGLSVDFLFLNNIGYIALISSIGLFLYNENIRNLYFSQNGYFPLLTGLDFIYAIHGFTLNIVTISQLYIWGFKKRSTHLKRSTKIVIVLVLTIVVYLLLNIKSESSSISLLDLAITLGYTKISMSLLKYFPQLFHNYKRKSVSGFSMLTVCLDITGGVLSILQLALDSYIMSGSISIHVLQTNATKLGLSLVTLFFDACYLYQWAIYSRLTNYEKHDYKELS